MKSLAETLIEKTKATEAVQIAAVPSVYSEGDTHTVEVIETLSVGSFIVQRENVRLFPDQPATEMDVVYTNTAGKQHYVGDIAHMVFLMGHGITSFLQPSDGTCGTCAVGFNSEENTWFGWSHRATAAFKVGSTVSRGDCAYVPTDKEDLVGYLKGFWEHGVPRQGGGSNAHMTFTTTIENVRFDVTVDGVLGLVYNQIGTCSDPNGPCLSAIDSFEPYPVPWGRGEWTAHTIDDAKEMAVAFARSVS